MIRGLTDKVTFRFDGVIRGGEKNERGFPVNLPHFVLKDAPQLIDVLGPSPKELFVTFIEDAEDNVASTDLRYYRKSGLACVGWGETQAPGQEAAYFLTEDAPGVMNVPHELYRNARKRSCKHFLCPDYQRGECGEQLRMSVLIPEFSMTSIFRFTSGSIGTINDVLSTLRKGLLASVAKAKETGVPGALGIKGEIFRLYKVEEDINYVDPKDGQRKKRKTHVVRMSHVPFSKYMERMADKLPEDSMLLLQALRSLPLHGSIVGKAKAIGEIDPSFDPSTALEHDGPTALLTGGAEETKSTNIEKGPEPAMQHEDMVAANEDVIALCAELEKMGVAPNTEDNRKKLARMGSVANVIDYLKKRVAQEKKKQQQPAEQAPGQTPALAAAATKNSTVPAETQAGGLY